MQLIANESKIELRKKIGERAPFVGLIVLVASTVILFAKPEWLGCIHDYRVDLAC